MVYDDIIMAVKKLKTHYCEDDPFKLCEDLGIKLLYFSFGTVIDAVKGFYLENKRIKTITINSDLPYVVQRFIVAHELGHAILHRKYGVYAFHEAGLFDESSRFEKEANMFAAEFLLDDDDVLQSLNEDNTFFTVAANFNIPMELLDFKFRMMKWKGYKLIEPPVEARSNFLRDIELPYNIDYHIC